LWPWTQALRALIDRRDEVTLRQELSGGADWIAEIVPELRERLTDIAPLEPLRAEQARFALYDAVSGFLRCVSESDPLLLVLDDLHAADQESLALLDFVVRTLSEAPVLVAAAYQGLPCMRARRWRSRSGHSASMAGTSPSAGSTRATSE
jgi:predicted ATPase